MTKQAPEQQPKPAEPPPGAMTEQEAGDCWCPFARVPYYGGGPGMAVNRAGDTLADPAAQYRCIASSCMAWRWTDTDASLGYCGLAGALQP